MHWLYCNCSIVVQFFIESTMVQLPLGAATSHLWWVGREAKLPGQATQVSMASASFPNAVEARFRNWSCFRGWNWSLFGVLRYQVFVFENDPSTGIEGSSKVWCFFFNEKTNAFTNGMKCQTVKAQAQKKPVRGAAWCCMEIKGTPPVINPESSSESAIGQVWRGPMGQRRFDRTRGSKLQDGDGPDQGHGGHFYFYSLTGCWKLSHQRDVQAWVANPNFLSASERSVIEGEEKGWNVLLPMISGVLAAFMIFWGIYCRRRNILVQVDFAEVRGRHLSCFTPNIPTIWCAKKLATDDPRYPV